VLKFLFCIPVFILPYIFTQPPDWSIKIHNISLFQTLKCILSLKMKSKLLTMDFVFLMLLNSVWFLCLSQILTSFLNVTDHFQFMIFQLALTSVWKVIFTGSSQDWFLVVIQVPVTKKKSSLAASSYVMFSAYSFS
jgi:hypothetical protein